MFCFQTASSRIMCHMFLPKIKVYVQNEDAVLLQRSSNTRGFYLHAACAEIADRNSCGWLQLWSGPLAH